MPPASPTHSPDFPFRCRHSEARGREDENKFRLGSAPAYTVVGRRRLFPKHVRARFFPLVDRSGFFATPDVRTLSTRGSRHSGGVATTDNNLTYIHFLGPAASPIWLGWPAGSHEQVPHLNFSLLPRERPRNSRICFPGRKLCAGPRRASVPRKRNRGRRKNDTRSFTPRPYPKRRRAFCDPGSRKPPGANPRRSDAGSEVAFFGPEEKSDPKKGLSANEDRPLSLRGKSPASHVAARH